MRNNFTKPESKSDQEVDAVLIIRPGRTTRVLTQTSHYVHGVEKAPVMGDLCALQRTLCATNALVRDTGSLSAKLST